MTDFQFLKPNHLTIFNASAGSGKTYSLVNQLVRTLIEEYKKPRHTPKWDIPLRHLLATSFTNASAQDMKTKLLEFIEKLNTEDAQQEWGRVGISSPNPRRQSSGQRDGIGYIASLQPVFHYDDR